MASGAESGSDVLVGGTGQGDGVMMFDGAERMYGDVDHLYAEGDYAY